DNGKVWIDVSRLEPGSDGQAIYAAVANYAYNTHKVFVGDPNGLSRAAVFRRTSNMLSSALRFGTTDHLDAAREQIKGDVPNGIEPLNWHGKSIDKVEALIHTFVTTAENLAPELRDYHYDFDTATFRDAQGEPVSTDTLSAIRRIDGSGMDGSPRLGEATARRAILLKTLMGVEGSETSGRRGSILEQVLRWGDSSTPRNFDALFSRRAKEDDLHGNSPEGASAGESKPLVKLPGHDMIEATKGMVAKLINEGQLAVAPMAAGGSDQARALAKDYANKERLAQHEWTRLDSLITKDFTEEQQVKMWDAADQENDLRREGKTSPAMGLNSLNAKE
ncbi:MAG: hypothetical protein B7Y67_19210, partial [Polynucleobacter sp. 35-46-11]|uniref:hypothetical protein n=1 Tax=Polynucleobacter sp. 35-46-11 TaxID=1970425 RepID=UPI000BCB2D9D